MQEAGVSVLNTWETFYVIIGSAAAALTGLMFVVVTLMAGERRRSTASLEGVGAFATPTVTHFCAALLVAAILSAPWPALWHVSLLLGLSGLAGVVYVVTAARRTRRQAEYQPHLGDWLWYFALPVISYTALVVAAFVLPGSPAPALFVIAAVAVLLVFTGIRNAWDFVIYLAVIRPQARNNNQD